MSRALGNKSRLEKLYRFVGPEARGRRLFAEGKPCPPGANDKGKEHAVWRGWQRARMEAEKKR